MTPRLITALVLAATLALPAGMVADAAPKARTAPHYLFLIGWIGGPISGDLTLQGDNSGTFRMDIPPNPSYCGTFTVSGINFTAEGTGCNSSTDRTVFEGRIGKTGAFISGPISFWYEGGSMSSYFTATATPGL